MQRYRNDAMPSSHYIFPFLYYSVGGGVSSSLSSLSAKNDFYLSATAAERASRSW